MDYRKQMDFLQLCSHMETVLTSNSWYDDDGASCA